MSGREWHFRIWAGVWMLFSAWAAVLQIFLQERMNEVTAWGLSPGWQREIGLWNVGAVVLIFRSLRSKEPGVWLAVPVLLVWSALFGFNHLLAFLHAPGAQGHLVGFAMNLAPIIWAVAIWFFSRRERELSGAARHG
ncbi:MAG: hypothetical protein AB1405_18080 [Bdellovibrionota bacterium]